MAPVTLYELSIPQFTKGLNALLHILTKAEETAKEKSTSADDFVKAALCEDMRPLSFQIQGTCPTTELKSPRAKH
jgi:uncharacterized protein